MTARTDAVVTATNRVPREIRRPCGDDGRPLPVAAFFGRNTFDLDMMARKLPKPVFQRVRGAIVDGRPLDRHDADVVAHAVKEWALENGCTHFTHWFQPLTGNTAEKHDAFLTFDEKGRPLERFSGAELIQSEPDASSFPSGGMRSTFEARGYTAWDPSSPIFVMEGTNGNTLTIPSAFISYNGEALDKKTPLLRSMAAVERASADLLEALGNKRTRVVVTLGCEQEYFLIDKAYACLRPDLAITGRTVVGAQPPKGQTMDDHYFGAISPRIQAFMQEVEVELYKLGVPAKTRHNEVAPSQYEIAPIFGEANVAADQNQLVQEILRRVATRHGFLAVLTEKPFAGINGSGKHANWSLSCGGENLLEPGVDPSANLRFLAVLASVLLGVHRHGGLLRASVATYGNDFRLGANEAPPAIMSVFLGDLLFNVCEALAEGRDLPHNPTAAMIELGVSSIPHVAKDNTDRNRTSPLAFTGNKFEFRAVGADQNPAWPVTVLNTIVAEGMRQLTGWIREAGGGEEGAYKAVQRAMKATAAVRFEGDGYSSAWVEEAARRGLKNHRKTPEALAELQDSEVVGLFGRHGVLAAAEVESRFKVLVEQYELSATHEAQCLRLIVDEMVMPAVFAERRELLAAIRTAADVGLPNDLEKRRFARIEALSSKLEEAFEAMERALATAHADPKGGEAFVELVLPVFERVRSAVDGLEGLVRDELWPLPKYREMLFLV